MDKEQKLLNLKKQIEKAKEDKSKEEGKLEGLMERLQKEHGVDDLDAASKKVETLDAEIKKLEGEFETGYKELEENYEWD
jgi:chromosome segregation ATPase